MGILSPIVEDHFKELIYCPVCAEDFRAKYADEEMRWLMLKLHCAVLHPVAFTSIVHQLDPDAPPLPEPHAAPLTPHDVSNIALPPSPPPQEPAPPKPAEETVFGSLEEMRRSCHPKR